MYLVARVIVPDLGSLSCSVPVEVPLLGGDRCACELDHVHELGTVLELIPQEAPPTDVSLGVVLRKATPEDLERDITNSEVAVKAMAAFRKYVDETNPQTRPMKAHFSLRRERLTLWYATDDTTDMRQVVGHLQRQFATRVDARPMGIRDEAAMIGGCGICGRPLCCSTWLREYPAVHLRMARAQELSLLPSVVNGMCGRLKCCLRYENEQYEECGRGMPPTGYIVSWAEGEGIVVARDVLARKVTVKSDGRFLTLPVSELIPSRSPPPDEKPAERSGDGDDNGDPHHEDPDS